jgi:hypothetical protein
MHDLNICVTTYQKAYEIAGTPLGHKFVFGYINGKLKPAKDMCREGNKT